MSARAFAPVTILRQLAKQRVGIILQPGDVLVIERAVPHDEDSIAALHSCYLRGWAEPVGNAVPAGEIDAQGNLPPGNTPFTYHSQMYRLTDSGWSVVNRAQMWTLMTVFIGIISILPTVISTLAAHWKIH